MTSVPRNERKPVASNSSTDRMKKFLQETWVELRYKVSWPNRQQLIKSTAVVLAVVVIMSVYVYGLDLIFGAILKATIFRK